MAKCIRPVRVAVDTCLLLDLFLEEQPKYGQRTLRIFSSDDYIVYLPTLVGVEVMAARAMRDGQQRPPISNAHLDAARQFLKSAHLQWVPLDATAMKRAQQLGPERLIAPQDVAILASAIRAGCEFLFTDDRQLINNSRGLEEITVCLPPELPHEVDSSEKTLF